MVLCDKDAATHTDHSKCKFSVNLGSVNHTTCVAIHVNLFVDSFCFNILDPNNEKTVKQV